MNRGNAGRAELIRCADFLARHSDYVDGMLPPMEAIQLGAHANVCDSCARYDRIVRKGLDLLQDVPDVEPSAEFEQRLQHRIFHIQDEAALAPQRPRTGAAAALGVAAAIALLAWSPLLVEHDGAVTDAQVTTREFLPLAVAAPETTAPQGWYMTTPSSVLTVTAAGDLIGSSGLVLPGPYSPLVVQPPVSRAVRTVSRSLTQD